MQSALPHNHQLPTYSSLETSIQKVQKIPNAQFLSDLKDWYGKVSFEMMLPPWFAIILYLYLYQSLGLQIHI